MEEMRFSSCKADPDVCFRPSLKANGVECYHFFLYTHDILAMMEELERFLRKELGKRFILKEKYVGSPEQHLGNEVTQVTIENGVKFWSFRSLQDAQAPVKNVEEYRSRANLGPLPKAKSTEYSNYRPEADVTPELTSTKLSYCR